MDRGKRASKFLGNSNNKMYLDLKDVVREHALCFLPAKSVLKFRSVCRDWKLQILTPFFAHNQSISFKGVLGIFAHSPEKPPVFISLSPESCGLPDPSLSFLPEPVSIKSSSNGLICCQGRTGYNAYYVCNPVTKKFVKLPKQSADHGPDSPVVLIFEPSLLNFVAEFKLICPFASEDLNDAVEFDIYSSSEGGWKVSPEFTYATKKLVAESGVHVKGVVYWHSQHIGTVAYDMKKDKFEVLGGAYVYDYYDYGHKSTRTIGEINGKLCIVSASAAGTITVTPVRLHASKMPMASGGGGYNRVQGGTRSFTLDRNVLAEARHKHLEVLVAAQDVVCVRAGDTVVCYDIMKNETKVVGRTSGSEIRFLPYVNSLVYL